MTPFIIPLNELSMANLSEVGGTKASLGEMIKNLSRLCIHVPNGFAITVHAFTEFLNFNKIEETLTNTLKELDRSGLSNLSLVGKRCREIIYKSEFSPEVKIAIEEAYHDVVKADANPSSFAVRSSATAEDSPTASFAGQHDSFLNIRGCAEVLNAVRQCYASLFNDRAIKYRLDNDFGDMEVGISVGVQRMVRSDCGSAGVAFTIEPENGNENIIYITGAWGLGEAVVQGAVN